MQSRAIDFKIYKKYAKEILILSGPIIVGSLANMLIGVGDVIIADRHGTVTLGAISVASAIFMTFVIAAIGLMSSISPVVSNLKGERKVTKTLFGATVKFSVLISAMFFILIYFITKLVPYFGLAPELTPLVVEYLEYCNYGIFGAIIFYALKEFLQAYEIVLFPNLIIVSQIFLNVALNIILVFGLFGFPELGTKGLAIASTIVRTYGAIAIMIYCIPFLKGKSRRVKPYIKELLKTGWPISIGLFLEFLGFNLTAVLVGKFSSVLAATHNVVITLAGTIYMIPLSISNATAVKVGLANGEKNLLKIKRYIKTGMGISLILMLFVSFLLIFMPTQMLMIFTHNEVIIKTALPIMFIVACYLFFDTVQCVNIGGLKGLKDTKPIMATIAISYLLFGIPIGAILAFKYNIVLTGFWAGLALALLVASIVSTILLLRRIKILEKKY